MRTDNAFKFGVISAMSPGVRIPTDPSSKEFCPVPPLAQSKLQDVVRVVDTLPEEASNPLPADR